MKAFTKNRYGGPEVLQLEEVDKPSLEENHIMVQVKANSANPADWHILRGKPFLARLSFGLIKPKDKILDADFAGVVEAVGNGVSRFKRGDRVFGESLKAGAFAEYSCVPADACGIIPEGSTFREMACTPIAGVTALQALKAHGKLKEGESVLINGSSGGVGHFAVQIARTYGANVTAVCSNRNRDFVLGLGANQVIAYDVENIHKHDRTYDLVLDTHGNLTMKDFVRMGQRGVTVGFTTLKHMIWLLIKSRFSKVCLTQFTADVNAQDLTSLADMMQYGEINVHIEKTFLYQKIPDAIGYIEAMRTRGKVAMVWD